MTRRRSLLALAFNTMLSACPTPAPAETWMTATIASYHSRCPSCYNQDNFGLGGEIDADKNVRFAAGWYKNSQYRTSVYSGVVHTPLRLGPTRTGLMLGFVSGYEEHRLSLMVVPTVQIEGQRFGVNFSALPTKHAGLVVGLQLKGKF